jgi:hypothetical protein
MRNAENGRRPVRDFRALALCRRKDAVTRQSGDPLRVVAALAACALLAACAEEETGPQFANDPAPTRSATEAPEVASPVVVGATPVAATPASIADILSTRGAPSRVFVTTRDAVWSVATDGEVTQVFKAADGDRVIAADAAPGGERAAVLVGAATPEGVRPDVIIVDGAGQVEIRMDGVVAAMATPTPNGGWPTATTIDWSPQADRALVSFEDGAVVAFAIGSDNGQVLQIPVPESGSIVDPTWSPTGEAVAYIATSDKGRIRTLQVFDVRTGATTDVVSPPDGRFVVDYGWLPNGVSLLFTEGGGLGGAVTGIDLWRVDADGENRELVVSAGTVAPVARITDVRPSPDGRSVAYAVLVPGESDPRVDSVWVRDLESRLGFRVQLPAVTSVEDMTWTDQGLTIEVTTGGPLSRRPETRALLIVERNGAVSALWAAPMAMGTPIAGTPVSQAESN